MLRRNRSEKVAQLRVRLTPMDLLVFLLAGLLVVLGSVPAFSMVFQLLPPGVLHGATGLMFAMIMLAGIRVLRDQPHQKRTMTMLVVCTVGAMALTQATAGLALVEIQVPSYLTLLTSFPVASGAAMAILWEIIAPAPH